MPRFPYSVRTGIGSETVSYKEKVAKGLCWAQAGDNACNRQSTNDLVLCDEHYEEITGEGSRDE